MGIEIKSFRLQHVGHTTDGVGIEQDAAQHGFLSLQVLGWDRIGQGFEAGFLTLAAFAEPAALPSGGLTTRT
ncbi:MAG: Uncharacterised protein [Cyanobium sp. ARS6]|nr:MAG: Uncharacterised protein [Cyanobium sp. ARS6]